MVSIAVFILSGLYRLVHIRVEEYDIVKRSTSVLSRGFEHTVCARRRLNMANEVPKCTKVSLLTPKPY